MTKSFSRGCRQAGSLILVFALLLTLWETLSHLMGTDLLPRISDVVSLMRESFNTNSIIEAQGGGSHGFSPHIVHTLWTFSVSAVIGVTLAVGLALVAINLPSHNSRLNGFIEVMRTIPPLVFVPFFFIFFSATTGSIIAIISFYVCYVMFVYAFNAFENVKAEYIQLGTILGSSKTGRIFKVLIPAALPDMINGLRVVIPIALGVQVIAEYLGSNIGIGIALKFSMSYSRIDLLFVGILWVTIISMIFELVLDFVQKVLKN